jgi:multiple RNA-binding domain-containing protein 1
VLKKQNVAIVIAQNCPTVSIEKSGICGRRFVAIPMAVEPSTRLIVKNLPHYFTSKDLKDAFAAAGDITDSKILLKPNGKSRGFGFVGFRTVEAAERALSHFHDTFLDTRRITVEFAKSIGDPSLDDCRARRGRVVPDPSARPPAQEPAGDDPELEAFLAASRARNARPSWNDGPISGRPQEKPTVDPLPQKLVEATPIETNRLYVLNIPYETTSGVLGSFFGRFGEVTDVLIPIDTIAHRPKGFAFVTFIGPAAVEQAVSESVIFQGRHLQLKRAAHAPERPQTEAQNDDDTQSFRQKKWRTEKAVRPQTWNALFLNKDTVMDATAAILGLTKAQLLNPESDDLATRVTLAESQIIRETKEMFERAGINLTKLADGGTGKLSQTLLIAKNLKYEVTEDELHSLFASFGTIVRFIFPPTHANALIEYARVEDAQRAFRALSFKKVHGQPMYIQWAPAEAAPAAPTPEEIEADSRPLSSANADRKLKSATLIIKNVPFKATKKELYDIVGAYAKVKSIRMPKKADGSGHRGFAFLDFNTKQEALAAMDNLGDVHLYDRHLIVQSTDKGRSVESALE